jgi:hypothetical protein
MLVLELFPKHGLMLKKIKIFFGRGKFGFKRVFQTKKAVYGKHFGQKKSATFGP